MRWAGCDSETPEGAKFCIECDSALKNCGPSGGGENLPQAKFCAACGSSRGTAGTSSHLQSSKRKTAKAAGKGTRPLPKPKTSKSPPAVRLQPTAAAAERRQLTVMFCGLVGTTALAERLNPEEWRQVGREYQAACVKVSHRFEGHIAQYLGDGRLVCFGYPVAYEDAAQRARSARQSFMQYLPVRSRVLTRLRSRQEQGGRKNESRQDRAQSRWGSAHRGDDYERGGPKPR
ncbi:MAG: hypothetical protein E6J80_06090 [Deltaproteobacteria bacterium]|nr:MAG: hypothetical protein E6J80_06090 [Deltaproteobacteria bacterium]